MDQGDGGNQCGTFSNLEVLLLLQKYHAKGQKLKLDKMKV
jgi:hypothetical protein